MRFFAGTESENGGSKPHKGLGVPMLPLSNIEIAELTKIIENSHRYLQIAFAEELLLYSQANGIDFWELRDALNTKWNVNILEPRQGIGGHCLPKDTKMFLNSSNFVRSKIIAAALEADDEYRRHIMSTSPTIKSVKSLFADTIPNSS
jgi:UDP-N-acetyl-D-mannosaminuronate dehydrogenase